MRVVIVAPGTYNDERGQPVRCIKGDLLDTANGYGQTLLDEGFARPLLVSAPAPVDEPAPAPAPVDKPAPAPAPVPVDEPAPLKPKRQKKAN
jgi:hypothetical protein